jgi:alpha-tubulin suppressor-like RCC1 family protein
MATIQRGQRWHPYAYSELSTSVPKSGELVVLSGTPNYGDYYVFVIGDGTSTVSSLVSGRQFCITYSYASVQSTVFSVGVQFGVIGAPNASVLMMPLIGDGTSTVEELVGDFATGVNSVVNYLAAFKEYDDAYLYALHEPCFYEGLPYRSLEADNINNTPDVSPTKWAPLAGSIDITGLDELNRADIDDDNDMVVVYSQTNSKNMKYPARYVNNKIVSSISAHGAYRGNGVLLSDGTGIVWGQAEGAFKMGMGLPVTDGTYLPPSAFQRPAGETGSLVSFEIYATCMCALYDNGNFYTAGFNASGNLGLGDTTTRTVLTKAAETVTEYRIPKNISNDHNQHALFIKKSDGYWYGTGYNGNGQLGLGDTTNRTSFTQLTTLGTTVREFWNLGATFGNAFAQLDNGSVYAAGYNGNGELGNGTTTNITTWTDISSYWGVTSANVIDVTGGFGFYSSSQNANSFVVMLIKATSSSAGGTVKTCGNNAYGQLGDGSTVQKTSPVTLSGSDVASVKVFGGGAGTVFALMTDGDLYGWGFNQYGNLGIGTVIDVTSPTSIMSNVSDVFGAEGGNTYQWITSNFAVKTSGALWATGSNAYGACGDGTQTNITTFKEVPFDYDHFGSVVDIVGLGYGNATYHYLFLTDKGKLLGSGYNGQNGISFTGATVSKSIITELLAW